MVRAVARFAGRCQENINRYAQATAYLHLENINRYAQATAYLRLQNINRYAQPTAYLRLENINRYAQVTAYLRLENINRYATPMVRAVARCAGRRQRQRQHEVKDRNLREWDCLYCEWGGGVCRRSVRLGHENKTVCIVSEGYRDGKS